MKKFLLYFSLLILTLIVIGSVYLNSINNFKRDGHFEISTNSSPIKIHRDEYGIPYVFADNKADVIRGQGFVSAQDRLFQIAFYRALIKGELASLVGASMLQSDIKMRVLNLEQNALNSFSYLNEETKKFLTWYCEGFNEYLEVGKDEFPVELKLLNITATPITPEEIVAIVHFIGLNHGRNMEDEILYLNLSAQSKLANELLPLNLNPDRKKELTFELDSTLLGFSEQLNLQIPEIDPPLLSTPKFGSNNWAISAGKSKSNKVIVSNDPHLDARLLPGIFYPVGLFCPEFKSVGLSIPGIPGLIIGRNEFVAFGVTNGYGDSQDLLIEKTEGDFYFDENGKQPFATRKETIVVKDGEKVEIEIRSTANGSILSDFEIFGIKTKDVVSLKWSQTQTKSQSLGIERFLESKNIFEFKEALAAIDNMFFNFVIGDVEGNIAHQATGLIPIRSNRNGQVPQISGTTNWIGFIPKDSLPNMINPERGWVGTANHDTRPDDYPYYYSSHFSPNYRYLRMTEVLSKNKKFDAEDSWNLILDCKNMQAEMLNPLLVTALDTSDDTKDIASILQNWNHNDDINEVGATIYNVLYDHLTSLILDDELPDDLEKEFWGNTYFWNQKIDSFILANHSFIDNLSTENKETLNELIVEAGRATKNYLSEKLGSDQTNWKWGNIHTVEFVSPIRQKGFGKKLLGAEEFPKRGSNQTINRGGYKKQKEPNFETGWFSTFRMVADLNDSEKMMGVLAGGSSSRIFHPYYKSQLETWKNDTWIPYWLSKDRILENSKHELILD